MLLGQKRTSGFRVTTVLISSSKDLVVETARKAILEKGAEGYLWIGTVRTEHMGLRATPDQADIDYAKQCCEQHPGLPNIFVKVCYGGVATGDWKVWELHTSATPVQIHIHFAQRRSLAENFHFLDLDAEPVDVRSLTLEAMRKRAEHSTTLQGAQRDPSQRYMVMPAYASGTCFWISLFSAINPGVRTIPRKPCGVPLNHAQEIQEEHSVRELRDTVLRGLQEELANLRLRDGAADH